MSVSAQISQKSGSALPEAVAGLVARFRANRAQYLAADYNEANVRVEFIDPLLESLGWDVQNKSEAAEQYKPVKVEDSLRIAGKASAPDYSLRIGGARKILVEAKKPGVNLKQNADAALQLRRYAWSAQAPAGILTNFAEFAVYDCTERPKAGQTAGYARIRLFAFEEFEERWEWMLSHLSPDAIQRGKLDKLVADIGARRGAEKVGDAFLKQMENFRVVLAREIALRNKKLNERELNSAAQRTLDRIVFLRVCEDRGVEEYGRLQKAAAQPDVYKAMMELFRVADTRYNSGLFHFRKEKNRRSPDGLTPRLCLKNRPLRDIIGELYPPKSPYDLSALSTDIMGRTYERFLGSEIRLTRGHRARVSVEQKREVQRQGGVFYTPDWVVEYIVNRVLDDLLCDKKRAQARKLRILDPACGSGSFLLGAYQRLLNWHLDECRRNPSAHLSSGRIVRDDQGNFRLSLSERREILLENLWGVDKDEQAVEVTKLSLMLKCLEGENAGTVGAMRTLGMAALPDLGKNIQCGNSIVGPDFYGDLPLPEDIRDIVRVNPFDWETGFPKVFGDGKGFDAVIGNPPYVRQEVLGEEFKEYAASRYEAYHGRADLFAYFIERGMFLLKPRGRFCYIVANRWMRSNYGGPLRDFVREKTAIEEITDFGELPVIPGAATFPCIIVLRKPAGKRRIAGQRFDFAVIKSLEFDNIADEIRREKRILDDRAVGKDRWTMATPGECGVFGKMAKTGRPLEEVYSAPTMGVKTGQNNAFVIDAAVRRRLIRGNRQSAQLIKPVAKGDDVRGYAPLPGGKWLICIPRGFTNENRGHSGPRAFMEAAYPAVMEYLGSHEKKLKSRGDKGDYWWELRSCSYYGQLEGAKIVLPIISMDRRMTFDERGTYLTNSACFFPSSDLVLLAVLNSRLAQLWMKRHASVLGDPDSGGRINWLPQDVGRLPVPPARPGDKADLKQRKEIAALARRMLDLRARILETSSPSACSTMERAFAQMNRKMDEKVCGLYNLTRAQAKIVLG